MFLTKENIDINRYLQATDIYPDTIQHMSLYIWGQTNTGKTFKAKQLACKILNDTTEGVNIDIRYIKFNDLCKQSINSYSKDIHTKTQGKLAIEEYKECFLLIIDNLQTDTVSDHRKLLFSEIMDYRIENSLPFFIICNDPLSSLKSIYSESLIYRIQNACSILTCNKEIPISQKIKVKIPEPTKQPEKKTPVELPPDQKKFIRINIFIKLLIGISEKNKVVALRYLKNFKNDIDYMEKYLPFMKTVNTENIQDSLRKAELIINKYISS